MTNKQRAGMIAWEATKMYNRRGIANLERDDRMPHPWKLAEDMLEEFQIAEQHLLNILEHQEREKKGKRNGF